MAHVRYWAGAQEIAGALEQTVPAASLDELLAVVRNEHGDRMTRLLDVGLVLVDGERAARGVDQALAESAIVEILPPFAGG
ncbi:MAG TPA: MoaD/ThiS family protein [Mycobacteriales bacterium]|nr:MoaD/ThiS family protein [Mycobacteriales bacterium]